MKRFVSALALVVLTLSLTVRAYALPNAADPCGQPQGDGGYKASSAPISIVSSTATTQIIAAVAGSKTYVCVWNFNITGTTPTYQWSYGTGTNCGTGNTVLTGATGATASSTVTSPPFEGTQLVAPASQAVCLTLSGTTPGATGYVAYRQGP